MILSFEDVPRTTLFFLFISLLFSICRSCSARCPCRAPLPGQPPQAERGPGGANAAPPPPARGSSPAQGAAAPQPGPAWPRGPPRGEGSPAAPPAGRAPPGSSAQIARSAPRPGARRASTAPAPHGLSSLSSPPGRSCGSTGRRRPGHFMRRVGSGSAPLRAPPAPRSGSAAPAAPALQVKGSGRRRRGPAVTPTGAQRSEQSAPSPAPLARPRRRSAPAGGSHRPGPAAPRSCSRGGAAGVGGRSRGATVPVRVPVRVPAAAVRRAGAEGRALCLGGVAPAPAPSVCPRRRGGAGERRAGSGAEGNGAEAVPAPSPPGKLCSRLARGLDGRRSGPGNCLCQSPHLHGAARDLHDELRLDATIDAKGNNSSLCIHLRSLRGLLLARGFCR